MHMDTSTLHLALCKDLTILQTKSKMESTSGVRFPPIHRKSRPHSASSSTSSSSSSSKLPQSNHSSWKSATGTFMTSLMKDGSSSSRSSVSSVSSSASSKKLRSSSTSSKSSRTNSSCSSTSITSSTDYEISDMSSEKSDFTSNSSHINDTTIATELTTNITEEIINEYISSLPLAQNFIQDNMTIVNTNNGRPKSEESIRDGISHSNMEKSKLKFLEKNTCNDILQEIITTTTTTTIDEYSTALPYDLSELLLTEEDHLLDYINDENSDIDDIESEYSDTFTLFNEDECDEDLLEFESSKSSVQLAFDEYYERQEQIRGDLQTYLVEIKERTDEEGEKLIQFPDDYDDKIKNFIANRSSVSSLDSMVC
jgi:hypothetical protein